MLTLRADDGVGGVVEVTRPIIRAGSAPEQAARRDHPRAGPRHGSRWGSAAASARICCGSRPARAGAVGVPGETIQLARGQLHRDRRRRVRRGRAVPADVRLDAPRGSALANCGGYGADLELRATDEHGTSQVRISFFIAYPPCSECGVSGGDPEGGLSRLRGRPRIPPGGVHVVHSTRPGPRGGRPAGHPPRRGAHGPGDGGARLGQRGPSAPGPAGDRRPRRDLRAQRGACIERAGADVGLAAAGAHCVARFGVGARLCTVQDLHAAAAAKRIPVSLPQCWTFAAPWALPVGGLSPATTQGEAAQCAAYTQADGVARLGVSATWSPTAGLLLNGNTPCGTLPPIACCR
ncbi:MAG: hypothetical protein R3F43_18475 [bacterium]